MIIVFYGLSLYHVYNLLWNLLKKYIFHFLIHLKLVVEDNFIEDVTFSYQELMTESSRMPLFDLRKLNASLPVASVPNPSTQVLVMGAADDFIVVNIMFIFFTKTNTCLFYISIYYGYYSCNRLFHHFEVCVCVCYCVYYLNLCRMQKDSRRLRVSIACNQFVLKGLHMIWCWILRGKKEHEWSYRG